tara:strand:- start:1562 stop:3334 length:1773 start_codon:yes stop_codon:yes gene_type:complete
MANIKAGKAYVELSLQNNLTAGLNKAGASLKRFGAGVGAAGGKLVGLGTAILAPLGAAVAVFAKMGDELNKMAARTGVAVEALSGLKFAAEQSGTSLQTVEKGILKMNQAVMKAADGGKTMTEAFGKLGLSVDDLQGKTPDEQFKLIADRLRAIEDPGLRAALAMQIFGKAGAEMLPMIMQGSAGIDALIKKAEELGIVMSTEDANAAAKFTDTLHELTAIIKMAVFNIGASLAPLLTELVGSFTSAASQAAAWLNQNRGLVVSIAKLGAVLVGGGIALIALGKAITVVGFALSAMGTVLGAVIGLFTFLLSPIGVVIGATVAAAQAFGIFDQAGEIMRNNAAGYFGDLRDIAGTTLDGVRDALAAGDWKLAAQVGWAGIKAAWLRGTRALREAWIGFKFGVMNIAGQMWDGMRKGWTRLTSWTKKAWLKIKGWWTETDTSGQQAAIDQAQAAYENKLDEERRSALDANNAEAAAELQAIQDEENKAREALNKSREDARRKREQYEAEQADLEAPDIDVPEMDVPEMAEFAGAMGKITGALSSAAATRLAGDLKAPVNNVEERNAEANERTADGIAKLIKLNEQNALNFA